MHNFQALKLPGTLLGKHVGNKDSVRIEESDHIITRPALTSLLLQHQVVFRYPARYMEELETMWPDAYKPNWNTLQTTTSESDFGEASFELLKEVGIFAVLVASLIPTTKYTRNEAILCALILKTSKLGKAIIAMTAHLGPDRQLALLRELMECLGTLKYLLEDTNGSRFDQFVMDSLVAEREFLKAIKANIATRGDTLAIEESMERSIINTAKAAGIDNVSTLPAKKDIGWPTAELLLKGLGDNLYPSYRVGSSVIHTKWTDLLQHHLLRQDDGSFELNFDNVSPRPQPLYAAALLMLNVMRSYLEKVRPDALSVFTNKFSNVDNRIHRVVDLHSTFLDTPVDTNNL